MAPAEYPRPFPAFLLPSLPNLFRRRSSSSPTRSPRTSIAVSDAGRDSLGHRPSYRSSIASASSAMSSASSSQASPPSLCTSPSSWASSNPGSLSTSPISGGTTVFSGHPAFAGALTEEPLAFKDHSDLDNKPAGPSLQRVLPDTLRCVKCSADIAFAAQIVSKGFTGRHGHAYLVSAPSTHVGHLFAPEVPAITPPPPLSDRDPRDNNLNNVRIGRAEHRQLVTGAHVVADIYCTVCRAKLGWKYVEARDPSQRYKVGKFILETARVSRFRSWEAVDKENDYGNCDNDSNGYDDDIGVASSLVYPVGRVQQLMAPRPIINDNKPSSPKMTIEFDSDDEDECEDIFAGTWDADVVAKRRRQKAAARV